MIFDFLASAKNSNKKLELKCVRVVRSALALPVLIRLAVHALADRKRCVGVR